MFLPCHEDDIAMETAIMIWNKAISHTAYHHQTDGLAERMIQNLEDMIRIFCAYELDFKNSDGFTHDWCTLILSLKLAYKTTIHYSTGKTPEILGKRWNPKLPYDTLKKDLVDINPTARSFKIILEKAGYHANRCIEEVFKYAKERWDKSHKPPDFQVGDLVLVSTLNFNNIKGPKKFKDSFSGPFIIKALHGPNDVQLELTEEGKEKKIVKVLKERRTRNKKEREYLVIYRKPAQEDEWILEKDITNAAKLLRKFRYERRPKE
ncbi:hypothetical protein O181_039592 [Austropuccinia psidii MF-1]|uniref:Integrase catalytic domain-containing protein n=1 Tax=Austropuccinia psidii MF-1 TaxID=1389203 RepID=A0A9Q3DH43_9BASI|nr:hypothetical protein [Austropuccinia psidii MF-1]